MYGKAFVQRVGGRRDDSALSRHLSHDPSRHPSRSSKLYKTGEIMGEMMGEIMGGIKPTGALWIKDF
jgi:hypothetical protein